MEIQLWIIWLTTTVIWTTRTIYKIPIVLYLKYEYTTWNYPDEKNFFLYQFITKLLFIKLNQLTNKYFVICIKYHRPPTYFKIIN